MRKSCNNLKVVVNNKYFGSSRSCHSRWTTLTLQRYNNVIPTNDPVGYCSLPNFVSKTDKPWKRIFGKLLVLVQKEHLKGIKLYCGFIRWFSPMVQ